MEKKFSIYKIVMLVILTAFLTFIITAFYLYSYLSKDREKILLSDGIFSSKLFKNDDDDYADLEQKLDSVKATLKKYYLWNEDINEEELEKGAIEGYVAALGDKYTEYIPEDEMKEYTESITGNFVGIGIYMIADEESGKITVYYPIPDSPAEKAGIKSGDHIIKVDGVEYTVDDFDKIANYIKGEEGTNVNIVIERDGEEIPFDITRQKIKTNPITTTIKENNSGYILIPSFDEGTADEFKTKVEELQSQGAKSLIIDLRNNGGGIVDEATDIADYFLDKDDIIIKTVDKENKEEITYSKNKPIFDMPVVVLVNEYTASSSEILGCSLQDNERAKIIGTKTYGKGIIQTLLTLGNGSGMKITTEQYYTPNGNEINKVGIQPDEEIELPETVTNIYALKEEDDTQLQKALEILK